MQAPPGGRRDGEMSVWEVSSRLSPAMPVRRKADSTVNDHSWSQTMVYSFSGDGAIEAAHTQLASPTPHHLLPWWVNSPILMPILPRTPVLTHLQVS